MRRKSLIFTSMTILVLGSTSCGSGEEEFEPGPTSAADAGGFDELVRKAQDEGQLSLYAGTTEDATQEWVKGFEDEYGIDVSLYRNGSSQVYDKWSQEVESGVHNADVMIQNVYQLWEQAKEKDLVTTYETESFDDYEFSEILPSEDLIGTTYTLYQSIGAVVWNTDIVTPEQEALLEEDPVAAMADPAFKGEVALGDFGGATSAGNAANVIYNQAETYGWDWLDGLADNEPALFESQVPLAEQLVKGEYTVTFATDTLYNTYVEQGAPVRYEYPEPTSSAAWLMGIPTKTPHPHAARLFLEWATSAEGHDRLAELGTGTGTRTGWKDTRTVAEKSWYEPPVPWFGFATMPEMQGDGLAEFVTRVVGTLER